MAPKLQRRPSSFVPKKGKLRSALKRPSSTKSKDYMSVKYVRIPTAVGARGRRQEQTKWRRTLPELLSASNDAIVKMLTKDQILLDWKGRQCPRCERGTLSGLVMKPGLTSLKYRCSHYTCQHYLNPHYLHPIFTECRGPGGHSLQLQASALLLKLTDASNAQAHKLLGINHKALEDMDQKLMALRKDFVEERQKTMKIGDGVSWIDVEGDEATFNKSSTGDVDPEKAVKWEQWLGLVERGRPESLILHRLNPPETVKRAPGPGAVRKTEWLPLANKYLKDRAVIFHTDSARSYRVQVDGVVHDNVVHAKKRVQVKGKWIWKAPSYVKVTLHKVPGRPKPIKTKAGTQIIDRAWRFMKDRISLNQHCVAGSRLVRVKVRNAQYLYWKRTEDLWVETGKLCSWAMHKLV